MKKESKTDWKRIQAQKDEDIDLSESPELSADFFEDAVPWPAHKRQITLRLDEEVVDFFKSQGRGYQTAINNVLHLYVETHKRGVAITTDAGPRKASRRDTSSGHFTDVKSDGPFKGVRKETGVTSTSRDAQKKKKHLR